jgi:hypothetical protein
MAGTSLSPDMLYGMLEVCPRLESCTNLSALVAITSLVPPVDNENLFVLVLP